MHVVDVGRFVYVHVARPGREARSVWSSFIDAVSCLRPRKTQNETGNREAEEIFRIFRISY